MPSVLPIACGKRIPASLKASKTTSSNTTSNTVFIGTGALLPLILSAKSVGIIEG